MKDRYLDWDKIWEGLRRFDTRIIKKTDFSPNREETRQAIESIVERQIKRLAQAGYFDRA